MKGGDDVTEFEQIYREHFDTVYRFLIRLCRNEPLAAAACGREVYKWDRERTIWMGADELTYGAFRLYVRRE